MQMETGLLFLATIGAAGPFIGVFGTVWGIMNAFTSIASAQNATIAVVAPGIAESLCGGPAPAPAASSSAGRIGRVHVDFFSGPAPTGKYWPPSVELMADKKTFGSSGRARWLALRSLPARVDMGRDPPLVDLRRGRHCRI